MPAVNTDGQHVSKQVCQLLCLVSTDDITSAPMVKLNDVSQQVHGPVLARAAQHGLQLLFVEALERLQGEDIVEALPAATTCT